MFEYSSCTQRNQIHYYYSHYLLIFSKKSDSLLLLCCFLSLQVQRVSIVWSSKDMKVICSSADKTVYMSAVNHTAKKTDKVNEAHGPTYAGEKNISLWSYLVFTWVTVLIYLIPHREIDYYSYYFAAQKANLRGTYGWLHEIISIWTLVVKTYVMH